MNLSNNVNYLEFDGFPTNIKNNFTQEEIIQIDYDFHIYSEITDYYYDNTHLYLYTNREYLIIYDLSTEEVIYNNFLLKFDAELNENYRIDYTELFNKFIYYDDHLLLLGKYGTYMVTTDGVTKICDVSYYYARNYYLDNELYFLNKKSESIFEIYKYNEGVISLTETIDLNTTNYDNLLVISENYFYEENNKYVLYENPSISFSVEESLPIYDKNKQVIYYTQVNDYTMPGKNGSKYQKIEANGETSTITLNKIHNSKGIIINEDVYFTEIVESDMNPIEIINSDFEIDAIYNHLKLQPFWIGNRFSNSYIGNYQENDKNLEFLQVEQNSKHIVLTIYQLQERNVYLDLPFYTHYGLGIFIPIIIAFFIPLSNYRKKITYISFFTEVKKK